ncbi:MAG: hypothetical protein NZ739_01140 [Verrucomicrobiae bacterium]|nr:hypothetical protein [Verrucomicrobiae bacterium]
MMFATVAGGALMWGVHFLSKKIPEAEYSTLGTLLTATILIPTMPLQMVFAQQTALALATARRNQLASMIRFAWVGTSLIWFVAALVVLAFQGPIAERWQLTSPAALWPTLIVALGCLWQPLFGGVLQGAQNFFWLGWMNILSGVARLGFAAFVVFVLHGYAAGIMTGIMLSFALPLAVGIWQTRRLWSSPCEPFDRRKLLGQIIPLMAGFGAYQFFFSADTPFVKAYFDPVQFAYYVAAGTFSRALVWAIGPLTAVMFPKIVHSTAKAEKTDLMPLTLLCTAVLAVLGAGTLWALGPWLVRLVYKENYVAATMEILPWYAGAMIPLALLNVLVNNLLAQARFKVVPWLIGLAACYAIALSQFNKSMVTVLQTVIVFGFAALGICAIFTWLKPDSASQR